MSEVKKFIRHTTVTGLKEYFLLLGDAFNDIEWGQDVSSVKKDILMLVSDLSSTQLDRLKYDAERINHMSDEMGQAAIFDSVNDKSVLESLDTSYDRSCWVYLNEPENFKQAEEIKYSDSYRYGKNWDGYSTDKSSPLNIDSESIEVFKNSLKSTFGQDKRVKVEHFDRIICDDDGNETSSVQFVIYQEGLPDAVLEFKNDEDIVPRILRPVSEHAINYSCDTGVIEVVAAKQKCRDEIVTAFAKDLLKKSNNVEKITIRRFDLSVLLNDPKFDFDLEDGIDSVKFVMLKCKDLNGDGSITFDVSPKGESDINKYCQEYFTNQDPLTSGLFIPIQARIVITLQPENGSRRSKTIPVKITMPNGCDLRNRTKAERIICNKYLKRWKLVEEV